MKNKIMFSLKILSLLPASLCVARWACLSLLLFLLTAYPLALNAAAELQNGMAADIVIGQPDFNSNSSTYSNKKYTGVSHAFSDGERLYVSDFRRITIFNQFPTTNFAPADIVIGQPDFDTSTTGTTESKFSRPRAMFYDGTRFFVADQNNNRVLIWNQRPTSTGQPADIVLGQTTFTGNGAVLSPSGMDRPTTVFSTKQKLLVSDAFNRRVLIWNKMPTANGTPADVVLGQPDFFTNSVGTSASKFGSADGGVWFDGERLYIVDDENHRVLIYKGIPTQNFAPADIVLGQTDFQSNSSGTGPSKFRTPDGVVSNGSYLFVSDLLNHRVLVWNPLPTRNGAPANFVIGQKDFFGNALGLSAEKFNLPVGFAFDGKRLCVADLNNHRLLIYNIGPETNIALGPQFSQGKAVVGKVFWDMNGNGEQD